MTENKMVPVRMVDNIAINDIIPEDRGEKKFSVEDDELRSFGYVKLSINDLRRLRQETKQTENPKLSDALGRELTSRYGWDKSFIPPWPDELDATYVYPGDDAPPGKKWILVDDTDETDDGIYVIKENE